MDTSRFNRTTAITRRARSLRRETSRTEARLWPRLRGAKLGAPFRRQHPVAGYFADYCCVPLKFAVEIDGPFHDPALDSIRDAAFAAKGIDVIRFSVQDVDERLDAVIEAIYDAVQIRLLVKRAEERQPPG